MYVLISIVFSFCKRSMCFSSMRQNLCVCLSIAVRFLAGFEVSWSELHQALPTCTVDHWVSPGEWPFTCLAPVVRLVLFTKFAPCSQALRCSCMHVAFIENASCVDLRNIYSSSVNSRCFEGHGYSLSCECRSFLRYVLCDLTSGSKYFTFGSFFTT